MEQVSLFTISVRLRRAAKGTLKEELQLDDSYVSLFVTSKYQTVHWRAFKETVNYLQKVSKSIKKYHRSQFPFASVELPGHFQGRATIRRGSLLICGFQVSNSSLLKELPFSSKETEKKLIFNLAFLSDQE